MRPTRCHGIYMSRNEAKAIRNFKTTNIGDWLGSRVYSDTKGGCHCGGKFSAFRQEDGRGLPVCDIGRHDPPFYRIRAQVKDRWGDLKYLTIRHTKNGHRLTKYYQCLTILETVDEELEAGVFDVTQYGSKKQRESFKFKNFVTLYLAHSQKRVEKGEITFYGMKGKVKYSKPLLAFFGEKELRQIRKPLIDLYRDEWTGSPTTLPLSLGELRTMMKFAKDKGMIPEMPDFGKIEQTNRREKVLEITQARAIIPHVENPMYRLMIFLMSEYAIRPCEVRAIQFRDISLAKDMVVIQRHFSGSKILDGRKSNKKSANARLTFPLVLELKDWIINQARPLDSEEFIFKSPNGNPVFENTLPKAWSRTLQKLGLPHVQMYEIRHARGTEVLDMANGNMNDVKNFLGHSNLSTTEQRYARPTVKNEKFFIKKQADVISINQ